MKRCRYILQRLLYPNTPVLVPLMAVSGASLLAVFLKGLEKTALAYAAYGLSAYALTAAVLRLPALADKGKVLLYGNPFLHRYITEPDFKAQVSLYLSLGINLFYSVYKAVAGICLHSVWFGAMAFYYLILSTGRFLLLRSIRGNRQETLLAWKKYRLCGCLLLLLTAAVVILTFYTIMEGYTVKYPGYMIYGAAGYTFYQFGFAIVNLVKCRKLRNPVYSAGKIIALTAAMVSMFSLQTALLAAFGGGSPWQKQMNIWTGVIILISIAGMALFMMIHGTKAIRKISA